MKWFQIDKSRSAQPRTGTYQTWKPLLATEGRNQCVYCAIHESSFGGERNFHVEHYKPKSKNQFKSLKNVFSNLFYACAICNTFKGDAWPATINADASKVGFLDPSLVDYSDFFQVNHSTGLISSTYPAGTYMIFQIYLNRPQLILERRLAMLHEELDQIVADFSALLSECEKDCSDPEIQKLLVAGSIQQSKLLKLWGDFKKTRPYTLSQVTR